MENQHKLIKGYRDLSKEEIDLMNRIKAKGRELLDLHTELVKTLSHRQAQLVHDYANGGDGDELDRFTAAEPLRWASIGKTDIQTGISALVRAVAQPEGV